MTSCDLCGKERIVLGPLAVIHDDTYHRFNVCESCAEMSITDFFDSAHKIVRILRSREQKDLLNDRFKLLMQDFPVVSGKNRIHLGRGESVWCGKRKNSEWETMPWRELFQHFNLLDVCNSCIKAVANHENHLSFMELLNFGRMRLDDQSGGIL